MKSTVSTVVVILPLNALVRDHIVKICVLTGLWGHGRRCRRLDLCQQVNVHQRKVRPNFKIYIEGLKIVEVPCI